MSTMILIVWRKSGRENGLWQVTGNEETGFKVERKTMSEEQYRKALEVIESKGDDGLSK